MAKQIVVAGELYWDLDGQLLEIKRQLRQPNGYPYDPLKLKMRLQDVIEGRFGVEVRDWQIWKTIELGTGLRTADDFYSAFRLSFGGVRVRIIDSTKEIFDKSSFRVAAKKIEVDIAVVSVDELDFKKGAYLQSIYKRARDLGLKLCPAELGPQLRRQDTTQPRDNYDCFRVAMKPIDGLIFTVGHDEYGFYLSTTADDFFFGRDRFVFVLAYRLP